MEHTTALFNEEASLEHLRHYLPAQAALKDFVHHNTLHAFQNERFHDALWKASNIFGYSTYLSIDEFRELYKANRIKKKILINVVREFCKNAPEHVSDEEDPFEFWKNSMLNRDFNIEISSRLGQLRGQFKEEYQLNMNTVSHPLLFRFLATYLDQGVSIWKFPVNENGFLESLRDLERNKITSIFKTKRARKLLQNRDTEISDLLKLVVGRESLYEQYLFDQQFAHPGWSGFVSVVEHMPETLLSPRKISLKELILFELLLEIDLLDDKFGEKWKPISDGLNIIVKPLFSKVDESELKEVLKLWQEAFEWSYFDSVLSGIKQSEHIEVDGKRRFQGLFCIDDREYSFRRHIENIDETCDTYGTPGFFGVEFWFQPEFGKFYTKACPAPVNPKYLIKEEGRKFSINQNVIFKKESHSYLKGWLISNTIGFWSSLKLFFNLFRPSLSPATAYSFGHMDKHSRLQIEATGEIENGLSIGYTLEEMAERVNNTLKSISLTKNFAPIVYVVGHGGSSVNNPYYAGYDCGACCGRPGAVNARVFAHMANKKEVRARLAENGIIIPDDTIFIGAMHDTTRDEIEYYDEELTSPVQADQHVDNKIIFRRALMLNARERGYRFHGLDTSQALPKLYHKIKERSVSLFEPRPEWNHTDNALCLIGRKSLYDKLYLDKRPFINSYDFRNDPDGKYLLNILSAAVPVCGGINLEYYFSRVDQEKLGAGTKLPHNVVGLFAVNNGIDGDLRPGLPSQMIEIHDPVRILFVIEHFPDVVLKVITSKPAIYEWIANEWVLFSVKNPDTGVIYRFKNGDFEVYEPIARMIGSVHKESDILPVIRKEEPILLTE